MRTVPPLRAGLHAAALPLLLAGAAACASSGSAVATSPAASPSPGVTTTTSATSATTSAVTSVVGPNANPAAPSPDPRVGLADGWFDAGQAIWHMRLVSTTKPAAPFMNASTPGDARLKNSDLAFGGSIVYQGNYSGWQAWDVSDPRAPRLRAAYVCPGSQSDVSVYGTLLFVSAEATNGRTDCGMQGVPDTVSATRARGIRIIDVSNIDDPKYVTTVQTCRGSHTNTIVTDPRDPEHVYVYVSGSAGVRSASELPGCSGGMPEEDPNTALFRIEVIKVPLARPEQARIVSSPRIFDDLAAPPRRTEPAAPAQPGAAARPPRPARPGANRGPTQCHDITVYPAIGLAGGACAGYGLLLDIRDVANPKRIAAVADTNFSFWHSATFSNDGTKVLFSDEWGGGTQARCRATDRPEWGADAIFTIAGGELTFQSYYKLPAPQAAVENCVAHNGSLIPVPGRDVMVQSWYQGGISVFDWTNPKAPIEIAYFDRGPLDDSKLTSAGHWSAYWHNGLIYGSEIARGLDIFELTPSPWLSQNEIDAAKLVRFATFNPQEQPKLEWPAHASVVRAYLDQLERNRGLAADRLSSVRDDLAAAERLVGQPRSDALARLASRLDQWASDAGDAVRVRTAAAEIRRLAAAPR